MAFLAAFLLLWGCGTESKPTVHRTLTYTFDASTRDLIRDLEKQEIEADKESDGKYKDFDRDYKGLMVPESLLPLEPFVLGLSTQSQIPAVLILDAPWVQRYAKAGWLYELEGNEVFEPKKLAPSVAEAFSVMMEKPTGELKKELMAVPTNIKGNILFYRMDLLKKHRVEPPRTWEELAAACKKILGREPQVKYGLLLHVTNFMNDFYPILWGYGGRVIDGAGNRVLEEPQNLARCLAALRDLVKMQGAITPGPKDLEFFETTGSLRRAFYRGEALFMINWNTRLQDLRGMITQGASARPGCLTDMDQVGVLPIPCQQGQELRYSNIGSFGWGVNKYATKEREWIVERAKAFIQLVMEERFQLLAAEKLGQVPALQDALDKVKNKEVLKVYHSAFKVPDMRLKPRPYSRRLNNVLEKNLVKVLYGQSSPEEAVQAALRELKSPGAS